MGDGASAALGLFRPSTNDRERAIELQGPRQKPNSFSLHRSARLRYKIAVEAVRQRRSSRAWVVTIFDQAGRLVASKPDRRAECRYWSP